MALPNGSSGFQVGSGNLNELRLNYGNLATVIGTGTSVALTAAQVTAGMIVGAPGTTATYTLPVGSDLDVSTASYSAPAAAAHAGNTFDLAVINTGAASITFSLTGATGVTDGGNALQPVATLTSAMFRFRKSSDGVWVVYKVG
jgi:hypothetical protein